MFSTARAEQVVISEILCAPLAGQAQFIEILNNTVTVFDMAEWRVTGGARFTFPEFSTNQPGRAFLKPFERILLCGSDPAAFRAALKLPETMRVFGPWTGWLSERGGKINLKDKNGLVMCAARYETSGRWPAAARAGHSLELRDPNLTVDDWRNWTVSARPGGTPGAAPAPNPSRAERGPNWPRWPERPPASVCLNEIMSDPPSTRTEATTWLELCNRGGKEVDLSGWRLEEAVRYRFFSKGTKIAAGSYLVVAADTNLLRASYGSVPVCGNFSGKLGHKGGLVRLVDRAGNLVNEVDYKTGGDWPELAAGLGSSLELINPWMDNRLASAWRDSDETAKGAWREYACEGTYAELHTKGEPSDYKELHLHLVGEGHLALRDIWFGKKDSGSNYILNGTKLSDDGLSSKGWLCQGTHSESFVTNGELHLLAAGHGDNRPNRAEIDVIGMNKGETCQLKFKARWVSGKPRLIAQTWDHSVAGSFLVEVPPNLGTPGAANSCSLPRQGPAGKGENNQPLLTLAAAAPQVDSLLHSPAVPRGTNRVIVTTRVWSACPLASVEVFHRLDNVMGDGIWTNAVMQDTGHGLFEAEMPRRRNGQIVQFYVQATATNGRTCLLPRAGPTRPALYQVDDRAFPRDLRMIRFVVSAFDLDAMGNGNTARHGFKHPLYSNRHFNCTFISNEEDIFYSGGLRNSGSPFTRGGWPDRPKFKLPGDRPFRSHEHFYFDNDAAGGNFHNRVARYWLYLLGHPVAENEVVRVLINHYNADLREETEPVGSDLLNRNFAHGSKGDLYRIDDEWWFMDNWDRDSQDADWNYKGSDNPGRYRSEWMKRSNEVEDDYTGLIAFFKDVSARKFEEMDKLLDVDAVLQYIVVRGYIADWDTFTMGRGKNAFFYRRPSDGKYQFLLWDSDLAFGDANGGFYGGRVAGWLERPAMLRLFRYYLAELHGKFARNSPRFRAWLQADEDASPAFSNNPNQYMNWCDARDAAVKRELGKDATAEFAIQPLNASNTVTNATVTLAGTAPCSVYAVALAGQPKAAPLWKDTRTWKFPDVPLLPRSNHLSVLAYDRFGVLLQRASLTVTRQNSTAQ
ncbi:MAG: lamin tail domain-containing protein [Verrucomicrobia bacterium]|nr:lamin tail domain-containing protein [Verrucomicrobiota bacterium]